MTLKVSFRYCDIHPGILNCIKLSLTVFIVCFVLFRGRGCVQNDWLWFSWSPYVLQTEILEAKRNLWSLSKNWSSYHHAWPFKIKSVLNFKIHNSSTIFSVVKWGQKDIAISSLDFYHWKQKILTMLVEKNKIYFDKCV